MRKLLLAALLALAVGSATAAEVTILSAHRIHTMDTNQPQAQAMAYDASGKILALGDAATLAQRYPGAQRLDVGNATVVPGLIDAHGHLPSLGMSFLQVDLDGTRSKAEILARLQAFAAKLPPGAWLTGRGWDQNDWPEQAFPTVADLDAAFPDRPIWLRRVDGHAGWANSAALRAVKRDLSGTWQPDGGVIRRDAQGRPSGVLIDVLANASTRTCADVSNDVDALASRPFAIVVRKGAGVFASTCKAWRRIFTPSNNDFAVASLRLTRR